MATVGLFVVQYMTDKLLLGNTDAVITTSGRVSVYGRNYRTPSLVQRLSLQSSSIQLKVASAPSLLKLMTALRDRRTDAVPRARSGA